MDGILAWPLELFEDFDTAGGANVWLDRIGKTQDLFRCNVK